MKDFENTALVLRRCKLMNCVHEGQSFSLGLLDSELGGRETTKSTMETMGAAGLLAPGGNGTYVLTGSGAEAVAGLAVSKKPAGSGKWQARRAEAKPTREPSA